MRSPPPPLAWPYPRYSHYIMARARSSHRSPAAPRALYTPADTRTPPPRSPPKSHPGDLSFGQRSAGTGPRSGCEPPPPPPPPPRYTRFLRATRGLAPRLLPFPPGRRDPARRRFPARPGGELRSPAPKDEPPGDSDLAGAVGEKAARVGAGPGRGQGGSEPTRRRPRVTDEETQENPRCSPRRRADRERGVTGEDAARAP